MSEILSSLGKFNIWKTVIFGTIIGVILIGIGLYLKFFYEKGWISTTGTITNIACKTKKLCNATINFKNKNGKNIIVHNYKLTEAYTNGSTVKLYYNPSNVQDITLNSKRVISWILLIFGVLLLYVAIFTYLMRKNKTFQYIEGVSEGAQIIKKIF